MSNNVIPVDGAALYTQGADSGSWVVFIIDPKGYKSVVQKCGSFDSAVRSADAWQTKANTAVKLATLRSKAKRIDCAR